MAGGEDVWDKNYQLGKKVELCYMIQQAGVTARKARAPAMTS